MEIQLAFEPDCVIWRIHDDGRGFDPRSRPGPREGHFGLLGMSERVKRVGGKFNISSGPEHGTTVEVEIPLAPVAESAPSAPESPPPLP